MGLNEDFYLLYEISGISVFVTGLKSLSRDRVLSGFMGIVGQESPIQAGSPSRFYTICRRSSLSFTPNQSLFQNGMAISSCMEDGCLSHLNGAGTTASRLVFGESNSGRRAHGVGIFGLGFIHQARPGKWYPCCSNVLIHSNAD